MIMKLERILKLESYIEYIIIIVGNHESYVVG